MTAGRRVLWLALGGTLQARGHDATDRDRYWRTGETVAARDLLADLPERLGPVDVEEVSAGASHDLTPAAVLDLAARLRRTDPATVSGVVVSLGSNALEEVAFLLWLVGPAPVPVVLTAAMRPPTALGTDATANLVAALTLAATPEGVGAGCVVVSDDAVLHPVGLAKTHTHDLDAFRAGGHRLGTVHPGERPRLDVPGCPSPLAGLPLPDRLAPVALVASHLGADGGAVRAAVASGARGVVVSGLGAGFVPAAEREALDAAHAAGVVVCVARRTARGRTADAALTAPHLGAGLLTAVQARLLLAVALATEPAPGAPGLQDLVDACRP
ncbi:asparaginase [Nocardioides alkalitolerans]|uniref:asparaginase n=1 Tax=Nocardioides alkalitolerans TaxID=281714 RepID=UPI0004102A86|nr:asparaginase domain-containing protein [Nocardioides alkalitolerans]